MATVRESFRATPKLRSPIGWYGGKGAMTKKLIPILENIPHRCYVEPFGGGASVLIAKPPRPVEVYNDIDKGLYDFFRVIIDPDLFEEFYRRVVFVPYHRELFYEYRRSWQQETDLIKRVSKWFIIIRQCNSAWSYTVTQSNRGMPGAVSRYLSSLDQLPEIHERLSRILVECLDWREVIPKFDSKDTLFYLDPPYVHETRTNERYTHELTTEDHQELVEVLLDIEGAAVLSGYAHEVYSPLEQAGWQRKDWNTVSFSAVGSRETGLLGKGALAKAAPRVETVWIKPVEKTVRDLNLELFKT